MIYCIYKYSVIHPAHRFLICSLLVGPCFYLHFTAQKYVLWTTVQEKLKPEHYESQCLDTKMALFVDVHLNEVMRILLSLKALNADISYF